MITNIINGKSYIGKTSKTIDERMKEHIKDSKKERCEIRPLYRAFKKYGVDSFEIKSIEKVENDDLSEREKFWISYYDTFKNGYNATEGGDGSFYIDRNEVIETYKKIGTVKGTVRALNIDAKTVRTILRECNVERTSKSETYKNHSKRVLQFGKDGKFIQSFNSVTEASLNILGKKSGHTNIARCCRGVSKSAYGFIWKFE